MYALKEMRTCSPALLAMLHLSDAGSGWIHVAAFRPGGEKVKVASVQCLAITPLPVLQGKPEVGAINILSYSSPERLSSSRLSAQTNNGFIRQRAAAAQDLIPYALLRVEGFHRLHGLPTSSPGNPQEQTLRLLSLPSDLLKSCECRF